jgi:hypothetical protein
MTREGAVTHWTTIEPMNVHQLAEYASNNADNPNIATATAAAFNRLQTIAMQEASAAQIEAAQATKDTAEFMRQSAFWMKASAIVLAAASVINLIVTVALNQ